MSVPRYAQAAVVVRAQIADGTLKPGAKVPSGAALARLTGFGSLTCRRAIRNLVKDGTLVPGASPGARPRVASGDPAAPFGSVTYAARKLSAGLAALRRDAGLTQPQLATLMGCSVTTVGAAETWRLWQAAEFWEHADTILGAGGELLRLYDAHRAGPGTEDAAAEPDPEAGPVAVLAVWADGTVTPVPAHLADLDGLRAERAGALTLQCGTEN